MRMPVPIGEQMNTNDNTQPTPDRSRSALVTITICSAGVMIPEGPDWRLHLAGALRELLPDACDELEEGDVEWGDWEDDRAYGDIHLRWPLPGV
jgi:hypothetical protein